MLFTLAVLLISFHRVKDDNAEVLILTTGSGQGLVLGWTDAIFSGSIVAF